MCKICDQWKSKTITSKDAFDAIAQGLKAQGSNIEHLVELSETIISAEVPMNEVDQEADSLWTDENGK